MDKDDLVAIRDMIRETREELTQIESEAEETIGTLEDIKDRANGIGEELHASFSALDGLVGLIDEASRIKVDAEDNGISF